VGVDDEGLRVEVYDALARSGRAPSLEELAAALGADASAVRAAVRRLAGAHHLVLDDTDAIVMAHPFATVPLGFSVMGRTTLWWGGCAWDSFALPHLLPEEPEVLVATRCPACGAALAWVVGRDAPPTGDEVAHFLVPVARMWDDVLRTCGNQRLFCDRACVDAWLADVGETKGYVMDLATLWRLASRWYDGRLAYGYTRRDPATAQQYFRDSGLSGPFWGV
jgi:Alkylmercury lyase